MNKRCLWIFMLLVYEVNELFSQAHYGKYEYGVYQEGQGVLEWITATAG